MGNFVSLDVLRVFHRRVGKASSEAGRPHILGNLSVEFRPVERVRILESLVTDRFHIASSSSLGRSLTGTTPSGRPGRSKQQFRRTEADANRFAVNLNQNQLEGVVDLTSRLSVRGGYPSVWSDT